MDSFLVTGATGVIGRALVFRLLKDGHKVFCPVRNITKAARIFGNLGNDLLILTQVDLQKELPEIKDQYDYIVHCASPTASRYFVENPVETIEFGLDTTIALLKYSSRINIKSFVYLSSLEVYGTIHEDDVPITEDYQGYVNPLEVRSSYNMVKRMCESLCHAYSKEYDVPVKIARLTQVIPSATDESDMRVFAQFARAAAKGKDIELHTEGTSARPYVQINDVVEAILTILYNGKAGEAYNVCNEETYISAREMAEFVQSNFNPQGRVVMNPRSDMGYAPPTKINLDASKLRKLGWVPKYGLYEMYESLISSWSN